MGKDADYYAANTAEFDGLSDDEKELVFSGGKIGLSDNVAVDEQVNSVEQQNTDGGALDTGKGEPLLSAKDGVHTIPYQELIDARSRANELQSLAIQQAEELKALKQSLLEGGATKKEVKSALSEYAGEYPEVADDLKPFIESIVNSRVEQRMADFNSKVNEKIAPVEALYNQRVVDDHFNAIKAAHHDYEEILNEESKLLKWIEGQPSFAKDGYLAAFERGTTEQVIELFSAFKASTGIAPAQQSQAKVDAKAVIEQAKRSIPTSFSDIPSGVSVAVPDDVSSMSAAQLASSFAGKTPEEISRIADRMMREAG